MLLTCLNYRNKIERVGAAPRPLHDMRLDIVSAPSTSYLRRASQRVIRSNQLTQGSMRNVKCTSRAITLHHARTPTQFRYQSRGACFVHRYIRISTMVGERRAREKDKKLHTHIYAYHGNTTQVCVLYLARYPHGILLLTNTLITQRNLLAFVPSAYLKTTL